MHTFEVDGPGCDLRVVSFEGREGISELFRFEIVVASPERDLDFDEIVGCPALLTFRVGDDPRYVHGVVSSFEQGEEGKKLTFYHVTLVPRAHRLELRRDSRIFQGLSTPDILKEVFDAAGVTGYRLALKGSYAPRDYCVQYRETDLAFASRLMEEEGIHYFFEHTEGDDVIVIADASSAHDPIPGDASVAHRPSLGSLTASDEHISRFRFGKRVRSGKVVLRDYNFKKPGLDLESDARAPSDDDLEVYDYPGDYDAPGDGARLAKIRLEQIQAARKRGEGESACPRLRPGATFKLIDHGRDDFNREYLVTRVAHRGREPSMMDASSGGAGGDQGPYHNSFYVIPSDVPFRPPMVTDRPTIKGVQTAIVVGPSGEEIFTDEHGRIKVQFHWDRRGKRDDHSSCWIRVSQVWSGAAWGTVFIPRIGHEVVVEFIEGDPDRPLVVGSVYHGTNVPPYALPGEKTKSTIKSQSSKGGGGFNELRLEDKKGSEEIFLHAQKDWSIAVENDKVQWIGHDETLSVDHDRDKTVKNDQSETIGGNKSIDVTGNHGESIGGDASISVGGSKSVDVGGDHGEKVGGGQTITVGSDQSISVGAKMSLSVGADKGESVKGASAETVSKSKSTKVDEGYTITVLKDMDIKVTKNAVEDVGEKKTLIVGKKLTVQCGDATITVEKNGNISVKGKKITVKGEGPIKVEGKKLDVKSEGAVNVEASGKIKVKGSNVGMN